METPGFLTPTLIAQNAAAAGLEQVVVEQLIALAVRIAGEPTLRHCVEQIYAQNYQRAELTIEPDPETLFGAEVHKLYLLLAVDAVRQLRAVHQQRGIPDAITCESYGPLPMSARRFAEWHNGQIGLEDWVARYWFGQVVASGNLYRLGRMEYILEPFDGDIRVYRHNQSGQVQALAEAGARFTTDGYRPYHFDEATYAYYGWSKEEASDGWTATLSEDDTHIIGTPISPYGYALPTPQRLAKDEWTLILRNGDTVLDMHIPNFMPLHLDLLQTSLQRALDFFPRYHPERPFKAFVCSSWIFNTQWVDFLPATSNLLAFQQQGYLFPLSSNGAGGLYFIFGNRLVDLASAPQDTALRRTVITHLRAGGKLRNGGFFLLPDAVARFGQAPYRQPSTPSFI